MTPSRGRSELAVAFVTSVAANAAYDWLDDGAAARRFDSWARVGLFTLTTLTLIVLARNLRKRRAEMDLVSKGSDGSLLLDTPVGSLFYGVMLATCAVSVSLLPDYQYRIVSLPGLGDGWFWNFEVLIVALSSPIFVWLVWRRTSHARLLSIVAAYALATSWLIETNTAVSFEAWWSVLNYGISALLAANASAFFFRRSLLEKAQKTVKRLFEFKRGD